MSDAVLQNIWDNWTPYHMSDNGKTRSYIADKSEVDTDKECLHLAQAIDGSVYELD